MTDSYERATELVTLMTDAGIYATTEPQGIDSATVLVLPPNRTYDLPQGYTANWQLIVIVPGPGDGDAWKQMSTIIASLQTVVDIQSVEHIGYADHPAALVTLIPERLM